MSIIIKSKGNNLTPNELIQKINYFVTTGQSSEIKNVGPDWKSWFLQHQLYVDHKDYPEFNNWRNEDDKLRKRLKKIYYALQALEEVKLLNNKPLNKDYDVPNFLEGIIRLNIAKIQMSQLKYLSRDSKAHFATEISEKKKDFENEFVKLERTLSQAKISKTLDKNTTPFMYAAFRKHETIIPDFKGHVDKIEKAGMASRIINSTYGLISKIAQVYPTMIAISDSVKSGLNAIPFVNAILTSLPLLIGVVKTWVKKQSPKKKTIAAGVAVLVIGGIITAGLLPIAAGGIVVGLVAIGLIRNQVMPLIDDIKKVTAMEDEIKSITANIREISNTRDTSLLPLNNYERQYLMKKFDDYLLAHLKKGTEYSAQEINFAKSLIHHGDINGISKNKLLQAVTNSQTLSDFKQYRLNINTEHLASRNLELETLKNNRKRSMIEFGIGLLGLVGVILLLIPTPPTLILGASLLVGTAIAGPIFKFNLLTKAKDFFVSLFSKKSADISPDNDHEHDLGLVNQNDNRHESTANIIKQAPQNDKVYHSTSHPEARPPQKSDFTLTKSKSRLFADKTKPDNMNTKPANDNVLEKKGPPLREKGK